jgi:hypothetical protein
MERDQVKDMKVALMMLVEKDLHSRMGLDMVKDLDMDMVMGMGMDRGMGMDMEMEKGVENGTNFNR